MDANEMLESIREEINIWDKWTYDTDYSDFIFFTLSDCDEVGENITYYRQQNPWMANGRRILHFRKPYGHIRF